MKKLIPYQHIILDDGQDFGQNRIEEANLLKQAVTAFDIQGPGNACLQDQISFDKNRRSWRCVRVVSTGQRIRSQGIESDICAGAAAVKHIVVVSALTPLKKILNFFAPLPFGWSASP